jgi:sugar phosphate isomerase/epimerase
MMAEVMESQCRVGVVLPMAYPELAGGNGPVLDRLERVLADEFFGAVEITRINDEKTRREARAMLDAAGVDVVFACQPVILGEKLDLNAADAAARKQAVERCRELVDQAYGLGARIMMVMSGPDPGEAERDAARERLIDSLKQLCQYAGERAEDYLLAVSIENFDRTIDKRCLVGPTREAAMVVEAVRTEFSNCGLTLDLSHQPLLEETISDMIVEGADTLIQAHFGNCVMQNPGHPSYGDQHPPFGIPGGENGIEELRLFMEALIYSGYFAKSVPTSMPVLSMEIKPRPGESSEVVIANGKRALKYAWARLSQDRWAEGRI